VAGLGNNLCLPRRYNRSQLSPRRLAATAGHQKKGEPTDHAKRLVSAYSRGAQSGHQGRRLVAAGSSSGPPGSSAYFQQLSFQVYDREGQKMPDGGLQWNCAGDLAQNGDAQPSGARNARSESQGFRGFWGWVTYRFVELGHDLTSRALREVQAASAPQRVGPD